MSDRGLQGTDAGSRGLDTRNAVSVDSVDSVDNIDCVDCVDSVDSVDSAKWGFNRRICVAVCSREHKHFFVSFLRQQNHSKRHKQLLLHQEHLPINSSADRWFQKYFRNYFYPSLYNINLSCKTKIVFSSKQILLHCWFFYLLKLCLLTYNFSLPTFFSTKAINYFISVHACISDDI